MELEKVPEVLEWQASSIDVAMAGLGLPGAVTGGTVTGNTREPTRAHFTWELGVECGAKMPDPPRFGRASLADMEAALLEALGNGVTWQAEGNGLIITVPLREKPAAQVLPGRREPAYLEVGL